MIHTHSLDTLDINNAWLTIGVFDGVHLGHQALLRQLVTGAHSNEAPAVVLTFDPHPAVVLGGKKDFKRLTTTGEQLALLDGLGVDVVITQKFDVEFATQTAAEFMRHVAHKLALRQLLLGYDSALGRGRQGDITLLTELGQKLGYGVTRMSPVSQEEQVISSSAIRKYLMAGAVEKAAAFLGRWYSLSGIIIHGDGRGHTIHFPTANLDIPTEKLIPSNGIYATNVWLYGERFAAATNVGTNPTFTPDKTTSNVETYLLDFSGDLYGREIRLEFVQRLRDEMKFSSVDALISQIRVDVDRARQILFPPVE